MFDEYCKGGKDGGEGDGKERICTPGEAVAEQVNNALGKKLDALGVADEFAEIVNALISVLVETLLSEGHNLLNS